MEETVIPGATGIDEVNDRFGHDSGDRVLIAVEDRIDLARGEADDHEDHPQQHPAIRPHRPCVDGRDTPTAVWHVF